MITATLLAPADFKITLTSDGAAASAEVESWEYGTPLEFAEREAEEFPDSEESCEVLKKIKEAVEAL